MKKSSLTITAYELSRDAYFYLCGEFDTDRFMTLHGDPRTRLGADPALEPLLISTLPEDIGDMIDKSHNFSEPSAEVAAELKKLQDALHADRVNRAGSGRELDRMPEDTVIVYCKEES